MSDDELARLRVLESLTGAGFFTLTPDRNVVAFSAEMERLTGFSAEEVIGRHCLNAFRCPHCMAGCGVFERGAVGPTRVEIYRADGSRLEVVKSGRVVRDEAGNVTLGVEMVRAVETDAALEAHTTPSPAEMGPQTLDRLLGALGRYFLTADEALHIKCYSPSLPAALGLLPEAIIDRPLECLLGAELFGEGSAFRTAILGGERREGWRALLETADDGGVPVSVSAARIDLGDARGGGCDCMAASAVLVILRPASEAGDAAATDEDSAVRLGGMVARSNAIREIFRLVDLLHDNDATVLITGESGTGKELLARAIHDQSHRASGPFVVINCGALPGELMESELFGHQRGAFTGACRDKPGRFELADGGTIFLDEVGDLLLRGAEMPFESQMAMAGKRV